jgi:hypothetical protein
VSDEQSDPDRTHLPRNARKTVAVSSAPPKGQLSSFIVWWRASAPFALHSGLAAAYWMPLVRRHFILVAVLGLVITPVLLGQVDEYQVKAFFLSNFTRYVEWPSQKFNSATDSIVICILGRDPFGNALEQAVQGKAVEGRAVVVRQISEIRPQSSCHILFVSESERKRFRSSASAIRGSGVLTVGESEGFANDGGVITFRLEDDKVRFEINTEAAGREQLRISSKLLSLARTQKK